MPGMPEFTHRHDMIQKSTSLSTKDMQQWHSHQDHQGCEPTYFNTSFYLMRSYVICSENYSYLLFIQCGLYSSLHVGICIPVSVHINTTSHAVSAVTGSAPQ